MQHEGLQYGQGATANSHQILPFSHSTDAPQPQSSGGTTTSTLRQFRKKDNIEKHPATTDHGSSTIEENSSHVARVAPHNHYPPRQNDYYGYSHHQYQSEFTLPCKEAAQVKYSEISEPQSLQHVDHLGLSKHKEKEFMEMCNIPQQTQMRQPYPEHVNRHQNYSYDQSIHSQYLQKESQMYPGYKQESQYLAKEMQYQQYPMAKYSMPSQGRKYSPPANDFLSQLQRIHPTMARSIMNDQHLRDSQTAAYPTMDQNRMYSQTQRYYSSPVQNSPQSYPPNYPNQNVSQSYGYPPSCSYKHPEYARASKINAVPRFPSINPHMECSMPSRRNYHENLSMPMNYAPPPQKISPTYSHYNTPEYAQHYQYRIPPPKEYYPQTYRPDYLQGPQIPRDVSENRSATVSSSIKHYLENWAEEDNATDIPSIDNDKYSVYKESVRVRDDGHSEPVYVITSADLPCIESGISILPENVQYVLKNNLVDNSTGMIRLIESKEQPAIADNGSGIVNLHIVEENSPDCMLSGGSVALRNEQVAAEIPKQSDQYMISPQMQQVDPHKNINQTNIDLKTPETRGPIIHANIQIKSPFDNFNQEKNVNVIQQQTTDGILNLATSKTVQPYAAIQITPSSSELTGGKIGFANVPKATSVARENPEPMATPHYESNNNMKHISARNNCNENVCHSYEKNMTHIQKIVRTMEANLQSPNPDVSANVPNLNSKDAASMEAPDPNLACIEPILTTEETRSNLHIEENSSCMLQENIQQSNCSQEEPRMTENTNEKSHDSEHLEDQRCPREGDDTRTDVKHISDEVNSNENESTESPHILLEKNCMQVTGPSASKESCVDEENGESHSAVEKEHSIPAPTKDTEEVTASENVESTNSPIGNTKGETNDNGMEEDCLEKTNCESNLFDNVINSSNETENKLTEDEVDKNHGVKILESQDISPAPEDFHITEECESENKNGNIACEEPYYNKNSTDNQAKDERNRHKLHYSETPESQSEGTTHQSHSIEKIMHTECDTDVLNLINKNERDVNTTDVSTDPQEVCKVDSKLVSNQNMNAVVRKKRIFSVDDIINKIGMKPDEYGKDTIELGETQNHDNLVVNTQTCRPNCTEPCSNSQRSKFPDSSSLSASVCKQTPIPEKTSSVQNEDNSETKADILKSSINDSAVLDLKLGMQPAEPEKSHDLNVKYFSIGCVLEEEREVKVSDQSVTGSYTNNENEEKSRQETDINEVKLGVDSVEPTGKAHNLPANIHNIELTSSVIVINESVKSNVLSDNTIISNKINDDMMVEMATNTIKTREDESSIPTETKDDTDVRRDFNFIKTTEGKPSIATEPNENPKLGEGINMMKTAEDKSCILTETKENSGLGRQMTLIETTDVETSTETNEYTNIGRDMKLMETIEHKSTIPTEANEDTNVGKDMNLIETTDGESSIPTKNIEDTDLGGEINLLKTTENKVSIRTKPNEDTNLGRDMKLMKTKESTSIPSEINADANVGKETNLKKPTEDKSSIPTEANRDTNIGRDMSLIETTENESSIPTEANRDTNIGRDMNLIETTENKSSIPTEANRDTNVGRDMNLIETTEYKSSIPTEANRDTNVGRDMSLIETTENKSSIPTEANRDTNIGRDMNLIETTENKSSIPTEANRDTNVGRDMNLIETTEYKSSIPTEASRDVNVGRDMNLIETTENKSSIPTEANRDTNVGRDMNLIETTEYKSSIPTEANRDTNVGRDMSLIETTENKSSIPTEANRDTNIGRDMNLIETTENKSSIPTEANRDTNVGRDMNLIETTEYKSSIPTEASRDVNVGRDMNLIETTENKSSVPTGANRDTNVGKDMNLIETTEYKSSFPTEANRDTNVGRDMNLIETTEGESGILIKTYEATNLERDIRLMNFTENKSSIPVEINDDTQLRNVMNLTKTTEGKSSIITETNEDIKVKRDMKVIITTESEASVPTETNENTKLERDINVIKNTEDKSNIPNETNKSAIVEMEINLIQTSEDKSNIPKERLITEKLVDEMEICESSPEDPEDASTKFVEAPLEQSDTASTVEETNNTFLSEDQTEIDNPVEAKTSDATDLSAIVSKQTSITSNKASVISNMSISQCEMDNIHEYPKSAENMLEEIKNIKDSDVNDTFSSVNIQQGVRNADSKIYDQSEKESSAKGSKNYPITDLPCCIGKEHSEILIDSDKEVLAEGLKEDATIYLSDSIDYGDSCDNLVIHEPNSAEEGSCESHEADNTEENREPSEHKPNLAEEESYSYSKAANTEENRGQSEETCSRGLSKLNEEDNTIILKDEENSKDCSEVTVDQSIVNDDWDKADEDTACRNEFHHQVNIKNPQESELRLESTDKFQEVEYESCVGLQAKENEPEYRNVLRIEENEVLLEIGGELVEITVQHVNGKKIISVAPVSQETSVSYPSDNLLDINDNYSFVEPVGSEENLSERRNMPHSDVVNTDETATLECVEPTDVQNSKSDSSVIVSESSKNNHEKSVIKSNKEMDTLFEDADENNIIHANILFEEEIIGDISDSEILDEINEYSSETDLKVKDDKDEQLLKPIKVYSNTKKTRGSIESKSEKLLSIGTESVQHSNVTPREFNKNNISTKAARKLYVSDIHLVGSTSNDKDVKKRKIVKSSNRERNSGPKISSFEKYRAKPTTCRSDSNTGGKMQPNIESHKMVKPHKNDTIQRQKSNRDICLSDSARHGKNILWKNSDRIKTDNKTTSCKSESDAVSKSSEHVPDRSHKLNSKDALRRLMEVRKQKRERKTENSNSQKPPKTHNASDKNDINSAHKNSKELALKECQVCIVKEITLENPLDEIISDISSKKELTEAALKKDRCKPVKRVSFSTDIPEVFYKYDDNSSELKFEPVNEKTVSIHEISNKSETVATSTENPNKRKLTLQEYMKKRQRSIEIDEHSNLSDAASDESKVTSSTDICSKYSAIKSCGDSEHKHYCQNKTSILPGDPQKDQALSDVWENSPKSASPTQSSTGQNENLCLISHSKNNKSRCIIDIAEFDAKSTGSGGFTSSSYPSNRNPKLNSLQGYKNEVDLKLNSLNLQIPISKHHKQNDCMDSKYIAQLASLSLSQKELSDSNILMKKFLNREKLTAEEIARVRKIISYKRLMEMIHKARNPTNQEFESIKEDQYAAPDQPKPPAKNLQETPKKKRKRFRNLYTEGSSDDESSDSVDRVKCVGDYSVYQKNSSGVPKLIIKRTITADLQPVVRLERSYYLDLLAKKIKYC